MAFVGCKVSDGITGAFYSYCTCFEAGSTLEGGLVQRGGLVPMAK